MGGGGGILRCVRGRGCRNGSRRGRRWGGWWGGERSGRRRSLHATLSVHALALLLFLLELPPLHPSPRLLFSVSVVTSPLRSLLINATKRNPSRTKKCATVVEPGHHARASAAARSAPPHPPLCALLQPRSIPSTLSLLLPPPPCPCSSIAIASPPHVEPQARTQKK